MSPQDRISSTFRKVDSVRALIAAWLSAVAFSALITPCAAETFVGPGGASSRCVGQLRTPECALDTYHACLALGRRELCEAVRVGEAPSGGAPDGEPDVDSDSLVHEVVWKTVIIDAALALDPKWIWVRRGDVEMMFWANWRKPNGEFGSPSPMEVAMFFRRTEAGWRMVGWISDSGDTACEHHNPALQPDPHCDLSIPETEYREYLRAMAAAPEMEGRPEDFGIARYGPAIDPTPLFKDMKTR